MSYIEFLRPFAMKRDVWKHGNDMQLLLAHPRTELPIADIVEPPQKGLVGITAKLRQKVRLDESERCAFTSLILRLFRAFTDLIASFLEKQTCEHTEPFLYSICIFYVYENNLKSRA